MENNERTVATKAQQVLSQVRQVIVGKDHILVWVLATVLARGHILLEDIPGVGKTTMAMAFSKTLQLDCNRVQFTPDVLPSDVTGYSILDQKTGQMVYQKGAVLCNLFLADELNRATSRTQSALLEAMEEGQVTVDGVTYPVPQPFTVMATQNPTGAAGTQLLPDSQMDRFMVRLSLGYPSPKDEVAMVLSRQKGNPLRTMEALMTHEELIELQALVEQTHVSELLVGYVVELVAATRSHPLLSRGGSPRSTLAIIALSKALARLCGRDYVLPEDIQAVLPHVLSHRLQLSPAALAQTKNIREVITEILASVPAPKLG